MIDETAASLMARPGRLILTTIGTVIGIAALVATLGLAATAGNHIVTRFDELAATEVVIEPASSTAPNQPSINLLPWDAQERLERLNGVAAAGTLSSVGGLIGDVRAVELNDPLRPPMPQTPVRSASAGLVAAVRGTLATGRWFDQGHSDRSEPVAVIGGTLAEKLGVGGLTQRPAIFVGDQAFTVIGILESVRREHQLLDSVILPDGTAQELFGLERPEKVYVDTEVGAARLIASQSPLALVPENPGTVVARVPREPALVKARVTSDVQALLLLLGCLSLVVGGIGIANTTLVSVMERRGEIALRRSLGAQRRRISCQFLIESAAVGLLGGMVGAAVGVVITVSVAAAKSWTPVLQPWAPLVGTAFGALIGLLAGGYPAIRASHLEPITVLRGEA
ncbi:MAG: ABC transporter permease [Acidimicrobiia bacterium]